MKQLHRTNRLARVACIVALTTGVLAAALAPAQAQDTTPTSASPTTAAPSTEAPTTTAPTTVAPSTAAPTTVAPTTAPPGTVAPTTVAAPPATTSASGVPPTAAATTPTTRPGPTLGITKTLSVGARGPEVARLEQFLASHRYDVGKVDDRFDWNTWQGVIAFQKFHDIKRTGKVTPEFAQEMIDYDRPSGLVPSGGLPRIEVDITRQIMFLYDEGGLYRVIAVSTGSNRKYCETGTSGARVCGDARTPRGNYRIQRRIDGWRISELGRLYRPLYFTGGIAVHGALSVPANPASHGCVRISMSVAEWFPEKVKNGTAVYVYD